jgi:hypothetical protein
MEIFAKAESNLHRYFAKPVVKQGRKAMGLAKDRQVAFLSL